ncbi:MAG TPA: SigE family RNA polymerase sigma factor [Mycobacteriales bacterium]|nr:SigE family RNA polymerase sigma factor [Mycobacteriales bacterium]
MDRSEQDGFESFVAASGARLLRLAIGLTGDRGLAEDLVQETLARTYLAWRRIRDRDAAEAYARRILVTTHISLWRRRRVPEQVTAELPEWAGSDAYAALDGRAELWAALGRLGRKQRAVLVLRYYEDRDDTEVAALLGCSTSTVRSQAARALATLRMVPGLGAATTTSTERWSAP